MKDEKNPDHNSDLGSGSLMYQVMKITLFLPFILVTAYSLYIAYKIETAPKDTLQSVSKILRSLKSYHDLPGEAKIKCMRLFTRKLIFISSLIIIIPYLILAFAFPRYAILFKVVYLIVLIGIIAYYIYNTYDYRRLIRLRDVKALTMLTEEYTSPAPELNKYSNAIASASLYAANISGSQKIQSSAIYSNMVNMMKPNEGNKSSSKAKNGNTTSSSNNSGNNNNNGVSNISSSSGNFSRVMASHLKSSLSNIEMRTKPNETSQSRPKTHSVEFSDESSNRGRDRIRSSKRTIRSPNFGRREILAESNNGSTNNNNGNNTADSENTKNTTITPVALTCVNCKYGLVTENNLENNRRYQYLMKTNKKFKNESLRCMLLHEYDETCVSGILPFLVSIALVTAIYPPDTTILVIAAHVIGDAASALIGFPAQCKKAVSDAREVVPFCRSEISIYITDILKKSFEGLLAYLISAVYTFILITVCGPSELKTEMINITITSICMATIEYFCDKAKPYKDDNFLCIFVGSTIWYLVSIVINNKRI